MSWPARLPGAIAIVLGLLLAAGCGAEPEEDPDAGSSVSDSPSETAEPTPTPSPTPPPWPKCSEVWQPGATFPDPFEGCRANGRRIAADPVICESGQFLHTRGRHLWAVGGAAVQRTEGPYRDDPKYRQVLRVCTA